MPSTHVVYEGINHIKKDIKENEETSPVLSYAQSKIITRNNLKIQEKIM